MSINASAREFEAKREHMENESRRRSVMSDCNREKLPSTLMKNLSMSKVGESA